MANLYATITDFYVYYDERTIAELSNDADSPNIVTAKVNAILDQAASELDSYLEGRWPTQAQATVAQWTRPAFLTRWVCVRAAEVMFGRRFDMPKGLEKDIEWAANLMERLVAGEINMPGMGRSNDIALLASNGKGQGPDRVTDNILDLGFPPIDIRAGGPSE